MLLFSKKICLFILARDRQRERERKRENIQGGGSREKERENQADPTLSTEPYLGFDLRTVRSQPELNPRVFYIFTDFLSPFFLLSVVERNVEVSNSDYINVFFLFSGFFFVCVTYLFFCWMEYSINICWV